MRGENVKNNLKLSLFTLILGALILLDNYLKTGIIFQIDQILHHETIVLMLFTFSFTMLLNEDFPVKLGFRQFRKITGGVLTVLGLWLWWESYKCTVIWSKRMELFPSPFYLVWLPHWFWVDLAILLIILAYLWGVMD